MTRAPEMSFTGTEHVLYGLIKEESRLVSLKSRLAQMNGAFKSMKQKHAIYQTPQSSGSAGKVSNVIKIISEDSKKHRIIHTSPGDFSLQARALVLNIIETTVEGDVDKFPLLIGYK